MALFELAGRVAGDFLKRPDKVGVVVETGLLAGFRYREPLR